jgi:hypothetical protein
MIGKVFVYSIVAGTGLFIGLTMMKLWLILLIHWLRPETTKVGVKLLF